MNKGLLEQVAELGIESQSLAFGMNGCRVEGGGLPCNPPELGSAIWIARQREREPKHFLFLMKRKSPDAVPPIAKALDKFMCNGVAKYEPTRFDGARGVLDVFLKDKTPGPDEFSFGIPNPSEVESETETRRYLRGRPMAYDLIYADLRGVPVDSKVLLAFLGGGEDKRPQRFGGGARFQYGIRKYNTGSFLVCLLRDEPSMAFFCEARRFHDVLFQGRTLALLRMR